MQFAAAQAPAIVGLRPKAHLDDRDEARAIRAAMRNAFDRPLPIIWGGEILGWTWTREYGSPDVAFYEGSPVEAWELGAPTTYAEVISDMLSLGQGQVTWWNKNWGNGATQGAWYDLWPLGGNPAAGQYSGAARTAVGFTDATQGAVQHGGNVSPKNKYLTFFGGTAHGIQGQASILYDRVATYENCAFTANVQQTMTQTGGVPGRYASGAPGLRISLTTQTQFNTTGWNLTELTYTDQDGHAGHTVPTSRTLVGLVSTTTPTSGQGAQVGCPTDSGQTALWTQCPFLPMAVGDVGARTVASYTTSAANTGKFCLVLAAPLAHVPSGETTTTAIAMRSLLAGDLALLPQVFDGACLSFFSRNIDNVGGGSGSHQGVMGCVWQ